MAHVVMQAAYFPTLEAAQRAEQELQQLFDAYVEFEDEDPNPWDQDRVAPPLVEFGKRHGVDWPADEDARFLLKGSFDEMATLLRVDQMVFFWGGGFDLGGATLRTILERLGASNPTDQCHLTVENSDPDARLAELVEFLEVEDYEDQFELDPEDLDWALHSLTIAGPNHSRTISFDDSGVQDWAFVAILPQLDGEKPRPT